MTNIKSGMNTDKYSGYGDFDANAVFDTYSIYAVFIKRI